MLAVSQPGACAASPLLSCGCSAVYRRDSLKQTCSCGGVAELLVTYTWILPPTSLPKSRVSSGEVVRSPVLVSRTQPLPLSSALGSPVIDPSRGSAETAIGSTWRPSGAST